MQAVRRGLGRYSRDSIQEANDTLYRNMMALLRKQEQEKILRLERVHLERNIQIFDEGKDRIEALMSAIGVAQKLLRQDLVNYSTEIGEARQMQHMGFSIIRAQEEERRRVAREIHDGPAQSLANIVMRAEYCLKLMDLEPEKVREELNELMWLVGNSLEDVRKIIFDLRPMSLDDLGLLAALKRYIEQFMNDNDMYVELNVSGREKRLDASLEIALFRIIQESLSNVWKHSGAPDAVINITYEEKRIQLTVRDAGKGFDPEQVQQEKRMTSFGITGMGERVQLLKGTLDIVASPGRGTQVNVVIPIEGN